MTTATAAATLMGTRGGFARTPDRPGDGLLDRARKLASEPYNAPNRELPPPFAGLDYDAYRGIRPLPGRAAMLDLDDSFAVDLLPPGLYFQTPVIIDRITDTGIVPYDFAADLFSFDLRYFDEIPAKAPGAGFTGLRLRTPLNDPEHMDEFLVMQGASYFRAIGRDMVYGLSARTIALGSGDQGPEEFPDIVHLRLHQPGDTSERIEGLIDSPSLTAHIDMTITPGDDTRQEISVTVFPRETISTIGIAPLTTMYFKGPLRSSVGDDFRPAVHDSDVLVIKNGAGEMLWRPISNPARIQASAFSDTNPRSFGLYQSDRSFAAFQDTEAHYNHRPSAMVQPRGDWGKGAVTLIEIPTANEFMDNIVAFWRPEQPLEKGSEHRFDYDLVWTLAPASTEGAKILQARSGIDPIEQEALQYVVDFEGLPENAWPELTATDGAEFTDPVVLALPPAASSEDGTQASRTRVAFKLRPGNADLTNLRLVMRGAENQSLAPVWLHRWTRARDGGV
ncbi:glucan biosynthesis protein [Puniceibacterium sediminis]|uniref:glucan biosynthesis protein n=1 Tax=Puniceibacterium sediminis TaxID=1608407 RepID=UPI001FE8FB05|nr:glucan biosynthesis protein [Puniceibacterium sediminis]